MENKMKNPRYIVAYRDFDGLHGYYVIDTHHPLYNPNDTDIMGSGYTYGLSPVRAKVIALAEKMNSEETA
jgi:hypothetical protein